MHTRRQRASRRPAAVALLVALSLLPLAPAAPVASALDWDPVARWTFDEGSGSTAADSIGGADATREGAAWLTADPKVGAAALSFDGVGDRAVVPDGGGLELPSVTMSAWVRADPNNPPTTGAVIIEKGSFACGQPSFGIYVRSDGLEVRVRSATIGPIATRVESPLWDGAWHLIGIGITNGAPGVRASIDGLSTPLAYDLGAIVFSGAANNGFAIGGPVDAACAGSFRGDIDDVRIYPAGAAVDQIHELIPKTATTTTLDLVGPYKPNTYHLITANVLPKPRFGDVTFEFLDPDTDEVVRSVTSTVFDTGSSVVMTPWPGVGTWKVRATFNGITYTSSSDTEMVEIPALDSTTTLAVAPESTLPGLPVDFTATVTSDATELTPKPTGSVEFVEVIAGVETSLGSVSLTNGSAAFTASGGFAVGDRHVVARYSGDAERAPSEDAVTVSVSESASTVYIQATDTIETGQPVEINTPVGAFVNSYWQGATVSVVAAGTGFGCSTAVSSTNETKCTIPTLPVGTYSLIATYSGNSDVEGSVSEPWPLVVTPNTLHVTGVGVNYTTFYPAKDSYRDVLRVAGNRGEPASVKIRVYNSTGRLIKSKDIGRGLGTYAWDWSGRNSSGTILTAGTYKVKQTVTDAAGLSKIYTSSVSLSHKKLAYTTTYLTKLGSSIKARGHYGSGKVTISTSSGYARLSAREGSWAGVGYEFTLPAATVYKSLSFQVYVKGGMWTAPNEIKMQNFVTCPYVATADWNFACFDHGNVLGNGSGTAQWNKSYGSPTSNRSGRHVRGVASDFLGTFTIYKARVRIIYGVLR